MRMFFLLRLASFFSPSLPLARRRVFRKKPRVLVVGIGFKVGQSTLSNSPGLDVLERLSMSGEVEAIFADTLVSQGMIPHMPRRGDEVWTMQDLQASDTVIVTVRQVGFDSGVLHAIPSSTKIACLCRQ
ncbi:UDP-glucose/GDP-mannose dehydrogenase family, central domain [Geosmithia morbida]|uniref:UDP-glucose/GDP-mannose dehydrogenase family, central domain n=1 Tax=Geosmithia morbida TaxID=1094350 RepID=A0A9P4YS74_9HYPO|nr:UDP-glucose/GDP-mannose dehydrogenase family, central domain [Geosmithia morbida]KAF4122153.1 UDP-glucose/GDP-mannose dehydrogenase family, central domain [Geosmithia morbida]